MGPRQTRRPAPTVHHRPLATTRDRTTTSHLNRTPPTPSAIQGRIATSEPSGERRAVLQCFELRFGVGIIVAQAKYGPGELIPRLIIGLIGANFAIPLC